MKLYSAIYDCFNPFKEFGLFDSFDIVAVPEEYEEDGVLVVWGGSDISPSLYNKAVSRRTGADEVPSRRDTLEWELMKGAKERGFPIIGICRGAQMLCALEGGYLIQDVTNHGRSHLATTSDGRQFSVSSLHHQMMYPFEVEHTMLAWSTEKRSQHYLDVDLPVEVEIEPECVWFPKAQGLAIQWHPEYMDPSKSIPAQQYVYDLMKEYVLG